MFEEEFGWTNRRLQWKNIASEKNKNKSAINKNIHQFLTIILTRCNISIILNIL